MPDVAVCRDEHVNSSGLGRIEEFVISQRVPSTRAGLLDNVRGQYRRNAPRRPVIEEDTINDQKLGCRGSEPRTRGRP